MSTLDTIRSRASAALSALAARTSPRAVASPLTGTAGYPGGPPMVSPTLDPSLALWNQPGQTSTDRRYRSHKFTTYQGWYHWPDGWSPKRARDAITMHVKGWPYFSAAILRDLPKYPPIYGCFKQRFAPTLRTTWRHEGPDRAPGRFAADDLRKVWRDKFRPHLGDTLRTICGMGGEWWQVWWEYDRATGREVPCLERWPWEACIWRGASPAFPGGWYALTVDSGIVRMVNGDGHWIYMSHAARAHEMGAVIALGGTFVSGELARRDEAGLSEAAGRAAPYVELKEGVQVDDEIGLAVQDFVAEFGLARVGGVLPSGNKLLPFQITSDTDFFKNFSQEQLTYCGLVILGQVGTVAPTTGGVYVNLGGMTVAESLVDEDAEAIVRGWQALARAYCEINGQDYGDDEEPLIQLVGERYASRGDKAKAAAERVTLLANSVTALSKVFDLTQDDVADLADQMSTRPYKLRPAPAEAAPGDKPLPDLAQEQTAKDERADEAEAAE